MTGQWIAVLLLAAGPAGAEATDEPLWAAPPALAPCPGIEVTADPQAAGVKLTFRKPGEERRLLAVEVPAARRAGGAEALDFVYSLRLQGGVAKPVVVVFGKGGGVWYHTGARPLEAGTRRLARLRLKSLRKAAFSRGGGDAPDWANVEKLWLGVVLDGKAAGELTLHGAAMTDRPYRPTGPLAIACTSAKLWSIGKDAAATAKATSAKGAPGGAACVRIDYAFPGGRHMYMVPTVPVGAGEPDGYRALRLTYRATLPDGIAGLLVMLIEAGSSQYAAEPAPPASEQWRTLTIPLTSFRLGRWSKDANGRLDPAEVRSVAVGVHGVARGTAAKGTIEVAKIEFVP